MRHPILPLALCLSACPLLVACSSGEAFSTTQVQPDSGPPHDAGGDSDDTDAGDSNVVDAAEEKSCDPTGSPAGDPCVVDDTFGVFVSGSGTILSSGCGRREKPCLKLVDAVATAFAQDKKRVYVCDDGAGYDQDVVLGPEADGLELYGGFRCSDWAYYPGGNRAEFRTTSHDKPWVLQGVTDLLVDGFEIMGADSPVAGGASIAVAMSLSRVVFRNSYIQAGSGGAGEPGADGPAGSAGQQVSALQAGLPADCTGSTTSQPGGQWLSASSCNSMGGNGGDSVVNGPGGAGQSGMPWMTDNGGAGMASPGDAEEGKAGLSPPMAPHGAQAKEVGEFVSGPTWYSPASGQAGGDGEPGQGGGGGGAASGNVTCVGASGGAGGMGGCGGKKGGGGMGGGASIGVISWDSTLTFDATTVQAWFGGKGGKGGIGGAGGLGALGAPGGGDPSEVLGLGGKGGLGGDGGRGGCGSGGSGGPSIGVVYSTLPPLFINAATVNAGSPGGRGYGGWCGAERAPDGYDGLMLPLYEVKPTPDP